MFPSGGGGSNFRATEEDDIPGDVVGDHLDDPPELWQPVVRIPPLDGVLKPGDRLADQLVQTLDNRMQVRHHAPDPIVRYRRGYPMPQVAFAP